MINARGISRTPPGAIRSALVVAGGCAGAAAIAILLATAGLVALTG